MEENKDRFITPAWIRSNTGDLTRYLEKIGYTRSPLYSPNKRILGTSGGKYYSTSYQPLGELGRWENQNPLPGICKWKDIKHNRVLQWIN